MTREELQKEAEEIVVKTRKRAHEVPWQVGVPEGVQAIVALAEKWAADKKENLESKVRGFLIYLDKGFNADLYSPETYEFGLEQLKHELRELVK